jgi:hypothetical protein
VCSSGGVSGGYHKDGAYEQAVKKEEERQENARRKSAASAAAEAKRKEYEDIMALMGIKPKKPEPVPPPGPKSSKGNIYFCHSRMAMVDVMLESFHQRRYDLSIMNLINPGGKEVQHARRKLW